jgi:hypothetical protein
MPLLDGGERADSAVDRGRRHGGGESPDSEAHAEPPRRGHGHRGAVAAPRGHTRYPARDRDAWAYDGDLEPDGWRGGAGVARGRRRDLVLPVIASATRLLAGGWTGGGGGGARRRDIVDAAGAIGMLLDASPLPFFDPVTGARRGGD